MNKINLNIIKSLDLFNIIENHFNGILDKKKSSKYGRLYKTDFGKLWVRYDYKTDKYFYINLTDNNDKGTLIDFIQNNIIKEKNIGKVVKYLKDNNLLQ